jgi:ferredoxin
MVREKEGRIKIGRVACLACGHCVTVCPAGAIAVEEGQEFAKVAPAELTAAQLQRLLLQRRSIRRYESRPVPREVLEDILDAARYAPTAANCQCVCFSVILDPALRDQVAAEVTAFYRPTTRPSRTASTPPSGWLRSA